MSKSLIDSANRQYRAYIAPKTVNDPFVTTTAFKEVFRLNLKKALYEYGLKDRIKAGKPDRDRIGFTALNVACAEGIYLHLLAELLENENLIGATELFGVDTDPTLTATADEFCKVSKPPRPFLRFYLHDLSQPLEKCLGLRLDTKNQVQFDFIFGFNSMLYTRGARQIFERLYRENLKPGGVMYWREYVHTEGANGWIAPHPALRPILHAAYQFFDSFNPGIGVAQTIPRWLEELGAEQIQSGKDLIPWGGPTQRGKNMMRDILLSVYYIGPSFIEMGLLSQAEYDNLRRVVSHELTLQEIGQQVHMDTLARKPGPAS